MERRWTLDVVINIGCYPLVPMHIPCQIGDEFRRGTGSVMLLNPNLAFGEGSHVTAVR